MKKKHLWVGILIVLLLIIGFFLFQSQSKKETTSSSESISKVESNKKENEEGQASQSKVENKNSNQSEEVQSQENINSSTEQTKKEIEQKTSSSQMETVSTSESAQEKSEETNSEETYDITAEVNSSGLKKVNEQTEITKNDESLTTFTVQQDGNSIGNQHNLISFTKNEMSYTILNRGKGSIPLNKVSFNHKGNQVTLSWEDTKYSFVTNKKGLHLLEQTFK